MAATKTRGHRPSLIMSKKGELDESIMVYNMTMIRSSNQCSNIDPAIALRGGMEWVACMAMRVGPIITVPAKTRQILCKNLAALEQGD